MTYLGVDLSHLPDDAHVGGATESHAEHSVSIHNQYGKLFIFIEALTDALTVAAAVFGGYFIYRWLEIGKRVEYSSGFISFIAFAMSALLVILLDRDGAYRPGSSLLRIKETERVLRCSAQAFFLALPVTFFSRYQLSRWLFVTALICVPTLLVSQKQLVIVVLRALRSRGVGVRRVLIYGAGKSGQRIYSALVRSPKLGLDPVALVDDNPKLEGKEIFEDAYRHERSIRVMLVPITKDLLEFFRCEFLVIAIPSLDRDKFVSVVKSARAAKARIAYVAGESPLSEYCTEPADIDGIMVSVVGRPAKDWYYETAKRLFDLLISLVVIVALAPIWLAIAILVRIESPGPVLFSQERVGRNGRRFILYKFRTMYVDTPVYNISPKDPFDPRITRAGRFLRRTSMDELPQLLNVLRGDMSLVGPRPEMPFIVEQYTAKQRQRLQLTPGITGLWQLSADRAFMIHENLQYDLYYIRNRCFFMDFAILLHTVLFAMRGV